MISYYVTNHCTTQRLPVNMPFYYLSREIQDGFSRVVLPLVSRSGNQTGRGSRAWLRSRFRSLGLPPRPGTPAFLPTRRPQGGGTAYTPKPQKRVFHTAAAVQLLSPFCCPLLVKSDTSPTSVQEKGTWTPL